MGQDRSRVMVCGVISLPRTAALKERSNSTLVGRHTAQPFFIYGVAIFDIAETSNRICTCVHGLQVVRVRVSRRTRSDLVMSISPDGSARF